MLLNDREPAGHPFFGARLHRSRPGEADDRRHGSWPARSSRLAPAVGVEFEVGDRILGIRVVRLSAPRPPWTAHRPDRVDARRDGFDTLMSLRRAPIWSRLRGAVRRDGTEHRRRPGASGSIGSPLCGNGPGTSAGDVTAGCSTDSFDLFARPRR